MLALNDPTLASVFAPRTTIAPDGTVEGYASLFGEIDQARDMVMRGAFAATLRQRSVHRIPMLFQHDPAEPIGALLDETDRLIEGLARHFSGLAPAIRSVARHVIETNTEPGVPCCAGGHGA